MPVIIRNEFMQGKVLIMSDNDNMIMMPRDNRLVIPSLPPGSEAALPLVLLGLAAGGATMFFLNRRGSRRESMVEQVEETLVSAADQGRKTATQVAKTARHDGRQVAAQALRTGIKMYTQSQRIANEGQRTVQQTVKQGRKTATKATKAVENKYQERSPLVGGLLLAALLSFGEKLLDQYQSDRSKS
jgi:hypothetical protein